MKLKATTKSGLVNYAIVIALFAAAQFAMGAGLIGSHLKGLLVPICYYIILAVSLNLTVGVLGELSLGHAGFMCVGAYTSVIFSIITQDAITNPLVRMILAMIVGGAFAAIFGILIGIPVLRLRGDYLAIVTLAFGEIIKNLCNVLYVGYDKNGLHFSMQNVRALNLDPETGRAIVQAAKGVRPVPLTTTFTICFVTILIMLFVIMNLVDSRAGRAVMSVRDNRIAAETIGVSITKYKLLAFSVSAAFAGIAGVLYAHNTPILNTKLFNYNTSIMILVYVVLGGLGSIRGSIIATLLLYTLPELLRGVGDFRMLFYAIILILAMIVNNNDTLKDYRGRIVSAIVGVFRRKGAAEK